MYYLTRNMIADKAFRYSGRELRPGESFAATPVDANYLARHRKAHDAASSPEGGGAAPLKAPSTGAATVEVRDDSAGDELTTVRMQADDASAPDIQHLLDLSVAKIIPQLEALSLEDLRALRTAEQAGKTRASMIAALDDAIEKKAA